MTSKQKPRLSISQCGKKVEYQGQNFSLKDIIDAIYANKSQEDNSLLVEKYSLDYIISQLNKDTIL